MTYTTIPPIHPEPTARTFAQHHHAAQHYGDQPYITHLEQVRAVLADFGYDGPLGVAAWLHDTIEDTGVTREEIAVRFGDEVAALVWAVTGEGATRHERNQSAYAKIRAYPPAAILKLADRIANVEASRTRPDKLQMYQREHAAFAEALHGLGDERMWRRLSGAFEA